MHSFKGPFDCITNGGNYPGVTCKFPFYYETWDDIPYIPTTLLRLFTNSQYNLNKFDKCTDYKNNGKKWCATRVTSTNRYISGKWGECPDIIECNCQQGKENIDLIVK